jgi:hypothetical protein
MSLTAVFDTGGKPSTWFPPGGLVKQMLVTRIQFMWYFIAQTRANTRVRANVHARARSGTGTEINTQARTHTRHTHQSENSKKPVLVDHRTINLKHMQYCFCKKVPIHHTQPWIKFTNHENWWLSQKTNLDQIHRIIMTSVEYIKVCLKH